MNFSSVRVCIQYNSCRKLICFDYGLEEKEMLQKSLQLFELEEQFYLDYELIIPTLNCKITSSNRLLNNDLLLLNNKSIQEIVSSKDQNYSKDFTLVDADEESSQKSKGYYSLSDSEQLDYYSEQNDDFVSYSEYFNQREENDVNTESDMSCNESEANIEGHFPISLKAIKKGTFKDREELKMKLLEWSCSQKFKLNFKTQERINQDGVKVSKLICNKKNSKKCQFYLEFRAESNNQYMLHTYYNTHNHELEKFHYASAVTKDMLNRIRDLSLISKSYSSLAKGINKEFKMNFHPQTIYYLAKKLEEEELGKLTKDAQNLILLLKKDSFKRGSFY